jgi:hypothetical protein
MAILEDANIVLHYILKDKTAKWLSNEYH